MRNRYIILFVLLLSVLFVNGQTIRVVGFFDTPPGATAYKTISAALAAASAGDQIWVRQNIYEEGVTLEVKEGVRIYGGFYGREKKLEERNSLAYETILSGGKKHCVVSVAGWLEGFTVTDGWGEKGGGILLKSTGTVNRCRIEENHCTDEGGGVYCDGGGRLLNCLITRNTACLQGCAVGGDKGSVESCTVVENQFVKGVSLGILETPPDVCAGDTLSLIVPEITGRPVLDTIWELADRVITSFPYHTVKEDDDKTLVCKVVGICGMVISDTVRIVVNIKPTVSELQNPSVVCPGEVLDLSAITPEVNYNRGIQADRGWKLDGEHFDPATPLRPEDDGKELIYWAANCCGDSASPNTVAVKVTELPVLGSLVTPAAVCSGSALTLTAPLTSDGSVVDDQVWLLNGDTLKAPYTVGYADNGKSLWFEGLVCQNLLVSDTVIIRVDSLPSISPLPVFPVFYSGENIVAIPVVRENGSPLSARGWELDGAALNNPVKLEDDRKVLTYKAVNACGETTSNEVMILVRRKNK